MDGSSKSPSQCHGNEWCLHFPACVTRCSVACACVNHASAVIGGGLHAPLPSAASCAGGDLKVWSIKSSTSSSRPHQHGDKLEAHCDFSPSFALGGEFFFFHTSSWIYCPNKELFSVPCNSENFPPIWLRGLNFTSSVSQRSQSNNAIRFYFSHCFIKSAAAAFPILLL